MHKAEALPEEAQEYIGRELLFRIEWLKQLRADLQVGIDELDRGEGMEVDIEDVIREARRKHGPA